MGKLTEEEIAIWMILLSGIMPKKFTELENILIFKAMKINSWEDNARTKTSNTENKCCGKKREQIDKNAF